MQQHVIMDLDGTLINTEGRDYQSFLHTALEFGLPPPDPQVLLQKRRAGGVSRDILGELYGIASPDQLKSLTEFRTRYINSEEILCHDRCFDGIAVPLQRLCEAGTKLYVATLRVNKDHVRELLAREKIDRFFEDVFCVEDLGEEGRAAAISQDPMVEQKYWILRKLLAKVDLNPGHTPFVGDTIFDMQACRRLGFCGVGVCTGFTSRQVLSEYADHCFETMNDFAGWMLASLDPTQKGRPS